MPLYNPPASGGSTISTGTEASRPAAGTAGALYLPSDGYFVERDSGTAWARWGPVARLVDPNLRTWAWANQGTATITTASGAITLYVASANGNQLRIYEETSSGNYTVTMGFLWASFSAGNAPNQGIVVRDSVGGKAIEFCLMDNNATPTLRVDQWNSASSWSVAAFSANAGWLGGGGVKWLRIVDDGTNRIYKVSPDGQTWITAYSETRTTWCTPDRRGFGVSPQVSAKDSAMTVLSWEVV